MADGMQLNLLDLIQPPERGFPASNEAAKIDTPPKRLPLTSALPSPSWAWDQEIAGSQAAQNVRIHVSERWTGVVVEQVNDPVLGRRILWRTGAVSEYPFTPECPASRTVFMARETLEKLPLPVTELDRGDGYVRYVIESEE